MKPLPKGPPNPPGTSRSAQAAIRREQLLSTAMALFAEQGFAATSTRRIAEAAGVAEGLLFHYFATKEALLLELAERQNGFAGRVLTLVQQAAEGTARALLAAVASGFAEVTEQEASFIGFMSAEAQVNPLLRGPLQARTAIVLGGFVRLLERRVEALELRADASLSACAYGFFGGFSFFFAQHRDVGTTTWRREAAAFARAWAEQCWRGIATDAAMKLGTAPAPRARRSR